MKYPEKMSVYHGQRNWNYIDAFGNRKYFQYVRGYYDNIEKSLNKHKHSFHEINIIVSGEGRHYISERSCEAKQGMVFIIPPDIEHGYYTENGICVFHILLSDAFMGKFNADFEKLNGYTMLFGVEPFLRGGFQQECFLKLNYYELKQFTPAFERLCFLQKENSQTIELEKAFITATLIIEFLSLSINDPNDKKCKSNDKKFLKIVHCMEFVYSNMCEKINFTKLAEKYDMSYSDFLRKFKEYSGFSPSEYLLYCRLQNAKKLLLKGEEKITVIALECGFFDSSHFTKAFRKEFGISPNDFRKK